MGTLGRPFGEPWRSPGESFGTPGHPYIPFGWSWVPFWSHSEAFGIQNGVQKWSKNDQNVIVNLCMFLDTLLERFRHPSTLENEVFDWRVCPFRLFVIFGVRPILVTFLIQKRLHLGAFCPPKWHPKIERFSGVLGECPGRGPGGSLVDPVPVDWAIVEPGGWPGRYPPYGGSSPSYSPFTVPRPPLSVTFP